MTEPELNTRSSDLPRVSVIIPLHRDSSAFRRCLEMCLELDYPAVEVIVVSDQHVTVPAGVRSVFSGSRHDTGPGEKRDLGMEAATGHYLAFIDDDAAPRPDWLRSALVLFRDESVGAVAGPGVSPPESEWNERVGGAFYESWLGSGPYRYRFRPARQRDVDDYPAYNLIVRRKAAESVKGWGTRFYGGEDTVICLALVQAGWRIVYHPSVVVFHQRRPILLKHLAQIGNVGLHRGYFVKEYPETSLRLSYFAPTLGTIALGALVGAALFSARARAVLSWSLGAYLLIGTTITLLEQPESSVAVVVPPVALASHVVYGIQFARGLLTRHLDR